MLELVFHIISRAADAFISWAQSGRGLPVAFGLGIQAVTEVKFIYFPNSFNQLSYHISVRSEGSGGLIIVIMLHKTSPMMMCVLAIAFPVTKAQGLGLSLGSRTLVLEVWDYPWCTDLVGFSTPV